MMLSFLALELLSSSSCALASELKWRGGLPQWRGATPRSRRESIRVASRRRLRFCLTGFPQDRRIGSSIHIRLHRPIPACGFPMDSAKRSGLAESP